MLTLTLFSFSIHIACIDEEGVETRFSWSTRWRASEGALRSVLFESPRRIQTGEGQRWTVSSHDGIALSILEVLTPFTYSLLGSGSSQ